MKNPRLGENATALGEQRLHATCVAFGRKGVLLRGRPGAGKSDLALRLIMHPLEPSEFETQASAATGHWQNGERGPRLVGDDQVIVWPRDGVLMARPHPRLAGKLEVRGIGIVEVAYVSEVAVALAVDLTDPALVERLPEAGQHCEINGVKVPCWALAPFEASAVAKLSLAVARAPSNF